MKHEISGTIAEGLPYLAKPSEKQRLLEERDVREKSHHHKSVTSVRKGKHLEQKRRPSSAGVGFLRGGQNQREEGKRVGQAYKTTREEASKV